MPLTLDEHPALVVIDLQKGVVTLPTAHPVGEVVERAASLAATFRRHDLPVVLVNVAGRASGRTAAGASARASAAAPDATEIVPELGTQSSDILITKHVWGAFHGTELDARLRELGVTQVVLAGVATSIGVETTARSAYEHGYNVALATDAMTDLDAAAHENSVERIFPRLGELGASAEIIDLLEQGRR